MNSVLYNEHIVDCREPNEQELDNEQCTALCTVQRMVQRTHIRL